MLKIIMTEAVHDHMHNNTCTFFLKQLLLKKKVICIVYEYMYIEILKIDMFNNIKYMK